jgi:steroid 5-alpha reductase family enzyme
VAAVGVSKSNWVYGGGALAIVCLILFYSIPVMEDRMRTKKPAYVAYQQRVSKLIFWIRTQDRENDQVEMLNHPQNFAI